jgi:hypothetical protein
LDEAFVKKSFGVKFIGDLVKLSWPTFEKLERAGDY